MNGTMKLSRTLTLPEFLYLEAFGETRRQQWRLERIVDIEDPIREAVNLPIGTDGEFCVHGEDSRYNLLDGNTPPGGQPELWCGWRPSPLGDALMYGENSEADDYMAGPWLKYIAAKILAVWGITVEGTMHYRDAESAGVILARGGKVHDIGAVLAYTDPDTGETVFIHD